MKSTYNHGDDDWYQSTMDQPNYEYSVRKLLNPLLFCMRFYGIYVENEQLTLLKKVHALVTFLVTLAAFAGLVWLFNQSIKNSTWDISYIVQTSTVIIFLFCAYFTLIRNRKHLRRTLNLMDDIQRVAMTCHTELTFRRINYLIYFALLWSALLIGYMTLKSVRNLTPYFGIGGDSGLRLPKVGDPKLFDAAMALIYVLYIGIGVVSFATYVVICLILWVFIDKIDDVAEKARGTFAPGFVTDAKLSTTMSRVEFHHLVCCGVQSANNVFSAYLFICSTCELTVIMFITRNMNLHLPNATVDMPTFTDFLNSFVLFAMKNLCAGHLNLRIVTTLKQLYEIHDQYGDLSKYHNEGARNTKIKLYVQHNLMKPPAMTGWSLYTPSRSTVFTAATNILTYVLVLYRLTDAASPEDAATVTAAENNFTQTSKITAIPTTGNDDADCSSTSSYYTYLSSTDDN